MGWFDSPDTKVRKQVPDRFHGGLSKVEAFARHTLDSQPAHLRQFQLGIVLATWVKAGELSQDVSLSPMASRRIQDIYASLVKTIRSNSYQAFKVLEDLAKQDGTFGVPPEMYSQLAINVIMSA